MNKSILVRGSIIMGIFLVIIGAAVGCSMIKKDAVESQISKGDDVYLTLADFDLTKQELWEVMKNVDGLDYLMDYVDKIILADYIDAVTPEEVAKEVLTQTYLTDDEDRIAVIQADPEINKEYVDAFEQSMIVLGYNPEVANDVREYVVVNIAVTKMATEYILDAQVGDQLEITLEDMQGYYEYLTYNDACALEIRFNSATEASNVFDKFNLVPNYHLGIGEYHGTEDISTIPTDQFTALNTYQLTDKEVFSKYVELYNYMNPWMDSLPLDISKEDFCSDYSDIATFNREEMIGDLTTGNPNVDLANYIFTTLDLENEETIPFSYNFQTFGDVSMLVYKISEEPALPFADVPADRLAELRDEMVALYITDDVVARLMSEKREEVGLELFDPGMKLQYEYTSQITYDNNGSKTLIARFGDLDITADMLYDYMERRVGTFYSAEVAKIKRLILSDEYEEVYGTSRDYLKNNSDEMINHRNDLRTMKSTFANNGFTSYGFSSATYTWEEFLLLAFGSTNEAQVLENIYIVGNLQPSFIIDTLSYDSVLPYMQNQADNYFSLGVVHALLYVDFDKNFMPDDFADLISSFDASELTEYTALKKAFEDLILDKYNNDDMSLSSMIEEYNNGLNDDPLNEWAEFKSYGFNIMTETLSISDSEGEPIYTLNHLNSVTLDEAFKTSLKRIYDDYNETQNLGLTEFVDDRLTQSDFGLHLIVATKGDAFEQPTAVLDAAGAVGFTDGSEGSTIVPSESQFDIYNKIEYADIQVTQAEELLPKSVYTALENYYSSIFSAYFSQTGYSIVTLDYMLNSNPVYATNDAEHETMLELILGALYGINFPSEFVVPE